MYKKDSEEQHRIMLTRPIPGLVMSMAVPTVVSQLITVVYNTADTYFVSQIGTSASAAVGIVFSLMAIIQALGFGIGMGANSIISRKLGAHDNETADIIGSSAVFMALILGIILQLSGLFNIDGLMRILGSTDTILEYSCSYGRLILVAAPIMCISFVLNNILRAQGAVVFSMIGLCAGGITNVFLDPLFIFNFGMGIEGAALATAISQLISCVILLSVFITKRSIVHLNIHKVSLLPKTYMCILRTGFPTICRQGLASIASALLNIQASAYGDAVIAAVTIANKVYMLVRNVILGIGQGYQPIAGYNYGAGNKERVRKAFWFSFKAGTFVCVLAAVAFGIFSANVIGWFRNDSLVIEAGSYTLIFCSVAMPFMAYSTYVNQTIQCLGFSGQAAFLASCRQGIFFIPLVFMLPAFFGIYGVEAVQAVSDILTFFISIPFQINFFKKHLMEK